jgi:hypothetical protein
MNIDRRAVALAATALVFVTACGGSPEDSELGVGTATSPLVDANALNANALNANALNANALNANGLSGVAMLSPTMLAAAPLSFGALVAGAVTALEDTTDTGGISRQLAQYTASCALDPSQSFDFSWVDATGVTHDESYPGLLGLATDWAGQPLSSVFEQEWVSACLISRVNYLGVTVELSSRGLFPGLDDTPESELDAYTMQEGAFFGNVFTTIPTAYACDYVPDDAYSQSQDRFCAAGYVDASGDVDSCGIIQRLGSCDDYCTPLSRGQFRWLCAAEPLDQGWQGLTWAVITVFLQ